MSTNVIDYFAVLGRGPGDLKCDPFRNVFSDEKNIISASEVLAEAITDIAVIGSGNFFIQSLSQEFLCTIDQLWLTCVFLNQFVEQSVPDDTWSLLDVSADGNPVEGPCLAIRRYIDSQRLDYITDVSGFCIVCIQIIQHPHSYHRKYFLR